jgi:hypothetical protein
MNPQVGMPSGQGPGGANNPFLQFVQQLQSQRGNAPGQNMPAPSGQPPAVPGGAPVSALQQAQGAAGQAPGLPGVQQNPMQQVQDAAIPGENPGVTKNLLQAANALHGAIAQLTNPGEIQAIRSILMILTQLIQRDQQTQNARTGQGQVVGPGTPSFSPQGGGAGAAPGGLGPQGPRPVPNPTAPPRPAALGQAPGGTPQTGTGQRM